MSRPCLATDNQASHPNLQEINSLIQELNEFWTITKNETQYPSSLETSLQDADADFGIFDSLTLARKRLPSIYLGDEDLEDDFDDEDMAALAKPIKDEVHFEPSLDDVTKIGTLKSLEGHARRTGVRRGHQDPEEVKTVDVIEAPTNTKCHDGPTPHEYQATMYTFATRSKDRSQRPMGSQAA